MNSFYKFIVVSIIAFLQIGCVSRTTLGVDDETVAVRPPGRACPEGPPCGQKKKIKQESDTNTESPNRQNEEQRSESRLASQAVAVVSPPPVDAVAVVSPPPVEDAGAVVSPPPPPPPQLEHIVLAGRALFPYDSAQLSADGIHELTTMIDLLKCYSSIGLIDIVGHTDSRGAADYNQGLSEQRAKSIQLILQGFFPQVPITASGLGETAPIATNDTASDRRLNRRIEIRVEAIK